MKVEEIISISPNQRKIIRYAPSPDSDEREVGVIVDSNVIPLFSTSQQSQISCNPHDQLLILESTEDKTIMRYHFDVLKEFTSPGYKWFSKNEMYIHIPYEKSILIFDIDGVAKQRIEDVDGKVIFAYRDSTRGNVVYLLEKENEIEMAECLKDKCAIYTLLNTSKEKVKKVFLQINGEKHHLFIITTKKRVIEFFLQDGGDTLEGIFRRLSRELESVEYS